jgi:hypothetical protein
MLHALSHSTGFTGLGGGSNCKDTSPIMPRLADYGEYTHEQTLDKRSPDLTFSHKVHQTLKFLVP